MTQPSLANAEGRQELQGCEHCGKEVPIESMTTMGDCWFCSPCTDEWRAHFASCKHVFTPSHEHGDAGQYCEKCSGFVRDEDFLLLFPTNPTAGAS
jgi:hypothetical protein